MTLKLIPAHFSWKLWHWQAIQRGTVNFLRVITVLWLAVHFFLTFLYVLPTTPVEQILEPFIDATIGRFFNQNWDLFAPNPIDTDYALLVRPLTNNELKIVNVRAVPNGGWYDVSSPIWTQLGHPFAAYVKLSNVITNATSSYDYSHDQESLTLLIRFASAFCKATRRDKANYIALAIRERHSRAWPENKMTKPAVIKTIFIGIFRVDKSVENSYLYQL